MLRLKSAQFGYHQDQIMRSNEDAFLNPDFGGRRSFDGYDDGPEPQEQFWLQLIHSDGYKEKIGPFKEEEAAIQDFEENQQEYTNQDPNSTWPMITEVAVLEQIGEGRNPPNKKLKVLFPNQLNSQV